MCTWEVGHACKRRMVKEETVWEIKVRPKLSDQLHLELTEAFLWRTGGAVGHPGSLIPDTENLLTW